MNTRSHTRRNLVAAGLPLLALLGVIIWFSARPAPPAARAQTAPAAVPVTTTRAARRDVPVYLDGIGTVAAKKSVTIRTRIDGQLERLDFEEGRDVVAGQLLAQLDPRVQQAQLDQAKAQKARDQAQLANAELDLRRYTSLIKLDTVTRQTLDAQRAQVAQIKAAIQFDDAQISAAATQLSFTRITAPISGRTGAQRVDPGNIVHAADSGGLVVINQIDPIAVMFTLPEESFQDISRALRASAKPLTVVAYPRGGTGELGRGQLTLLDNQIDVDTGTVRLKGEFPNPDHRLWPGQYVNARLILGVRHDALTVPQAAVQRGPGGAYVYVVDTEGAAQVQPIDVAVIQDGVAVITQGLQPGQQVVVDGQYKLKPGLHTTESGAAGADRGSLK